MESLLVGFALAMDHHGAFLISLGGLLAIVILLTAGVMKTKLGWYLGTLWQICLIAYGIVVPAMYAMGALFALLWLSAYRVGRKGEAIRAQLLADVPPSPRT
jgi:hypothetical protein